MKHQRWMPCAVVAATMTLWAMTAAAQGVPGNQPNPNAPTTQAGVPAGLPPVGAGAPSYYQQSPAAQAGAIYAPSAQPTQGQNGTTLQTIPQLQSGAGNMGGNMGGNMAAAGPQTAPQNLPPLPNGAVPQAADFDNVIANYLSVTPAEIRQLRRSVDARSQAAAELPGPAPRPVAGSVSVSLSPGADTPKIRGFINQTSSFVVLDSSGAPWPVENFRVGNSTAFVVNRLDTAANGSSFTVDAQTPYARTNLALKLAGIPTPVMIDLVAGQKEFDERMELRVQGRGPNTSAASGGSSLTPATDSRLLPVLDGMNPASGKSLRVSGDANTRAWMMPNGRILVRTSMKLVSPASSSFISSGDGTNVYEIVPQPNLVGMSGDNFVPLTVSGW